MKIELNLEKKYFLAILSAIIILAVVFGVYAFGTYTPNVFGHSAGEIVLPDLDGDGTPETLTDAITEGLLGGGGGSAWRSVDLSNTQPFNLDCAYFYKFTYSGGLLSTEIPDFYDGGRLNMYAGAYVSPTNKGIRAPNSYPILAMYESCPTGVTGITGAFGGGTGGGGGSAWKVVALSNTQLFNPDCLYFSKYSSSGSVGSESYSVSGGSGSLNTGFGGSISANNKASRSPGGTVLALYESCPTGITGIGQ